MTITLTKRQLYLICNAVEYLGRHGIGQKDYKALMLEDWIDKKERQDGSEILLDMWKSIMYWSHYDKGGEEKSISVHSYPVMKIGEEPLIEIDIYPITK